MVLIKAYLHFGHLLYQRNPNCYFVKLLSCELIANMSLWQRVTLPISRENCVLSIPYSVARCYCMGYHKKDRTVVCKNCTPLFKKKILLLTFAFNGYSWVGIKVEHSYFQQCWYFNFDIVFLFGTLKYDWLLLGVKFLNFVGFNLAFLIVF